MNGCSGFRFLAVAAMSTAWLSAVAAAQGIATGRRPNIVFILADDLGCETLGCYGGQSYETPHLDRLAATGLRFRHCYSMPVCHPSRIALLTGRYPFRLKNPGWGTFPKAEEKNTVAHALKRAGYATAIAGKWQLTLLKTEPDHPHRLGFDDYCLFGWHEGPRYYQPLVWQNGKVRDDTKDRYGPDVYTEFLIDFMERNRSRPFFAFYSMALCHDVTDDLDAPVPLGPKGRYDSYKEMVEFTDQRVGRIVAALDRLGLRERTLVLFTGDNGTPSRYIATADGKRLVRKPVESIRNGRPVRGGKGQLTDAGTNVPLIANWPGTTPAGKTTDDLVDFSDFFTTFAALAGASRSEPEAQARGRPRDGHDFAPRLRGRGATSRRWAFAQQGSKHWVRTQRYKLYHDGRFLDVLASPAEREALAVGALAPEAARAHRSLRTAIEALLYRQF